MPIIRAGATSCATRYAASPDLAFNRPVTGVSGRTGNNGSDAVPVTALRECARKSPHRAVDQTDTDACRKRSAAGYVLDQFDISSPLLSPAHFQYSPNRPGGTPSISAELFTECDHHARSRQPAGTPAAAVLVRGCRRHRQSYCGRPDPESDELDRDRVRRRPQPRQRPARMADRGRVGRGLVWSSGLARREWRRPLTLDRPPVGPASSGQLCPRRPRQRGPTGGFIRSVQHSRRWRLRDAEWLSVSEVGAAGVFTRVCQGMSVTQSASELGVFRNTAWVWWRKCWEYDARRKTAVWSAPAAPGAG